MSAIRRLLTPLAPRRAFKHYGEGIHERSGIAELSLGATWGPMRTGQSAISPGGLLAAGYAASIENAVIRIAQSRDGHFPALNMDGTSIEVAVDVSFPPGHRWGPPSSIMLDILLGGIDIERAEEIVRIALSVCPYTIALDSEVEIACSVRTN